MPDSGSRMKVAQIRIETVTVHCVFFAVHTGIKTDLCDILGHFFCLYLAIQWVSYCVAVAIAGFICV